MTESQKPRLLSNRIIGAAIEVHRNLGPGLLESVYESALAVEFRANNIQFERQKRIPILYKGADIGHLVADFVVENRAIVEIKSVKELLPVHKAQLLSYMTLTNLRAGLLLNFNEARLKDGIKRMVL